MDWRTKRITQELRKHDKSLFAVKTNTGMIQVWRRAERWAAADIFKDETDFSSPSQFILALTDDWTKQGKIVEVGLLPLMQKIVEMDSWSKDAILESFRKHREQAKEMRDRERKNNTRAIAADLRKEFAKATNDINTASL